MWDPELTAMFWVSSHDGAYNVLFYDGSVKTFSDAGLSLFKTYAQIIQGNRVAYGSGGYNWINYPPRIKQLEDRIWRTYFDSLYAQN